MEKRQKIIDFVQKLKPILLKSGVRLKKITLKKTSDGEYILRIPVNMDKLRFVEVFSLSTNNILINLNYEESILEIRTTSDSDESQGREIVSPESVS
jgi:hypothetical protein